MSDDNQRHPMTQDDLSALKGMVAHADLEEATRLSKAYEALKAKPELTGDEKKLMDYWAHSILLRSWSIIRLASQVPGLLNEIAHLRLSCVDGMYRMANDHQREIDELRYQRMQDLADCNNNKDIALRDLQVQHLEDIAMLREQIIELRAELKAAEEDNDGR